MMTPHQKRVVDEKDELDKKLMKLKASFDIDIFRSLDEAERDRLFRQSKDMEVHSWILAKRIGAF